MAAYLMKRVVQDISMGHLIFIPATNSEHISLYFLGQLLFLCSCVLVKVYRLLAIYQTCFGPGRGGT